MGQLLYKTLMGEEKKPPALWMMRQAGRYLAEYRQVREQAGSFWNLCFNPQLACEVTLQPIRRFDYDAAIIFSDILVIPKALGQQVDFAPNHGPVLGSLEWEKILSFNTWDIFNETLGPVYEAIALTRQALPSKTDLIGFVGSPWTIGTYMLDGGKSSLNSLSRQILKTPEHLLPLLNQLTQATSLHLINQVKAGANVLQIFDSWAEIVPPPLRQTILFDPLEKIVKTVRQAVDQIPIIYFGRGISDSYLQLAQKKLNIAFGVDQHAPLKDLDSLLPKDIPLQGNLCPELLVSGGSTLDHQVHQILSTANNRPFVFNLGHGILPHTPIAHVERVCSLVRQAT